MSSAWRAEKRKAPQGPKSWRMYLKSWRAVSKAATKQNEKCKCPGAQDCAAWGWPACFFLGGNGVHKSGPLHGCAGSHELGNVQTRCWVKEDTNQTDGPRRMCSRVGGATTPRMKDFGPIVAKNNPYHVAEQKYPRMGPSSGNV